MYCNTTITHFWQRESTIAIFSIFQKWRRQKNRRENFVFFNISHFPSFPLVIRLKYRVFPSKIYLKAKETFRRRTTKYFSSNARKYFQQREKSINPSIGTFWMAGFGKEMNTGTFYGRNRLKTKRSRWLSSMGFHRTRKFRLLKPTSEIVSDKLTKMYKLPQVWDLVGNWTTK